MTANRLQHINEYYFSKKLREIEILNAAGKQVINLGIGSPDLPPHQQVITALTKEAIKDNAHAYQSYKGIPALRTAIAKWYKNWYEVHLNPDTEILPLIGSKEGIMHICMTYLNEGDTALVPNPGYPTYSSAVQSAGGTCISYNLTEAGNWHPDLDALEQQDLSKTKLMWVNYPHMPTGQTPDIAKIEELITFAKKHNILVCHDNPYSFILNETPWSILSIPHAIDQCLELNSLSKSHNMAGWRIGMLCGKAERINDVLRFKSNMDSGMYKPIQVAALEALSLGKDWFNFLNATYRQRRALACQLLNLLNCSYSTQQVGMFVWAKVPSSWQDGYQLSDDILLKANVFLTPGGIFGTNGHNYIRISLCSNEQVLLQAIERISAVI